MSAGTDALRAQFDAQNASKRDRGVDMDDPTSCARAIAHHFSVDGYDALIFWEGQFFLWREGAYRAVPITEVSVAVYLLFEFASKNASRRVVSDVIGALQAVTHLSSIIAPPCWLNDRKRDARDFMPVKNGILNAGTCEILPATPTFFTLSALPVAFDANPPEPVEWLKFLGQLWPNDQQSVDTLQEFAGLLLTPVTMFQKLLLIVGPKRSGKGTILRVLMALLGAQNVAAPTLGSLAQPFGLQPLIGKLAAFIGDARLGSGADQAAIAERLLSISGEDFVSVPRKFLADFAARLGVRFILSSNELPRLTDSSGALASRFIVLTLRDSFYGREDLQLEQRLRAELSAILKWCLVGRARLLERGHFVQPESAKQAIEQLEDLGSPIKAFIRDECEVRAGAAIPSADLYAAWGTWCSSAGRKPGSAQTFGRDLRAACPGLQLTQPRDEHGRQVRTYQGITLLTRTDTRISALYTVGDMTLYGECNGEKRVSSRVSCIRCGDEGCGYCE